ncbi:immunoglobulin-like domain-containing protein [Clostridium saudiense]|uniref:immunoglobulin-like domain-containing protein n=1 Tax=Clostridium saudiense TaxID=1414720 RepID=UPI00319DCCAA
MNDMIFIGKKGANIDEVYNNSGILYKDDIYDLIQGNQLNGTDRVLGRCKEKEFEIIETKDIIVTTHIRDNGSDVDRQPYNKDDESTAIQVSKETLIDYVVKVENNYERPAEDFEVYIPIPKKGVNMGSEVQTEEFSWDMILDGQAELSAKDKDGNIINASDLFEITYGLSANGGSNYSTNYSIDKDLIRVKAKKNIDPGVEEEIKFTFKAADNVEQADIGNLNVFNAYYRRKYDNGAIDVRLKGNYVGVRLSVGQIKGIAFLDNNRNGLYEKGVDTLLDNIEVELWSNNQHKETTKTDSTGAYKFEGLSDGEYEIRVKNSGEVLDANNANARRFTTQTALSGESYKNDSDILSGDNINGSVTINIPTKSNIHDNNDYINIGFIEPVKVNVIDDGNGTVSGTNSGKYRVWPFTDIDEPEKVVPNNGYTFVNYTNEATGNIVTFPSQVSSDITIIANFEKKLFKVTLDPNGGNSGSLGEKNILFEESIKKSLDLLTADEKPTRDGHTLVGWARNQDGSGLIDNNDKMEAADLTLYAVWDEAPVIDITGDLIIKKGEKVNLLSGVSAKDKEDGPLNNIATGRDKVDENKPGEYNVTYTVRDKAGNEVTVDRKVKVYGDPVISGTDELKLKVGETFDKSNGVSAKDSFGVDLTLSITVVHDVKVDIPGQYTAQYTVRDAAENEVTEDRVVKVYGTPVIYGTNEVTIKVGGTFNELDGVTARDSFDGDLTSSIKISDLDKVDVNTPGQYTVKYTVKDVAGNEVTIDRTIIVDGAPVITGADNVTIKVGSAFNELDGVTAEDKEDGPLTNNIVVSGMDKLDVNTPGEYTITYIVTDKLGNVTTINRIVKVDGAPVITGADNVTIKVGSTFNELDGITAEDKEDGPLTNNIVVSGMDKLDLNTPGEYTIAYTVTDSIGNITTVNRIVNVVKRDDLIIIGGGNITLKPSEIESFDPTSDLEVVNVDSLEDLTINVKIIDGDNGQVVDEITKPKSDTEKEFIISIDVTDIYGSTATAERVVTVTNYVPIINGLSEIVIKEGEVANLLDGVTATDVEDGEITDKIVVSEIDLSKLKAGEHELEYTVIDSDGNQTNVKRIVKVVEAVGATESNNVVEEVQDIKIIGYNSSSNPSTGDKGMLSYFLVAMTSMIGLAKNTKRKKNKK